ncbi:MAG: hypothetical protein GXO55_07540 [Chloroflexi bacterium]|nr:hypothetical protein [Chloroflexota bacterium]
MNNALTREEERARELERLRAELKEAQEELEEVLQELEDKPEFGLGVGSPRLYDWEMNLARRDLLLERIAMLEEAIERLEKGQYGICEVCGNPIEPERLELFPETTLCATCARERSRRRR